MALRVAHHLQQSDASARDALLDYIDQAIAEGHAATASDIWRLLGEPANGRGFDWRIAPADGVYVTRNPGEWRMEFSGREPETCELLRRPLPAGEFVLRYEYRTENLAAKTGIAWGPQLLDSASAWRAAEAPLTAGWIRLTYRRPSGSVRAEGVLWLRNLRVEPAPPELSISRKPADKDQRCCK